MDSQFQALPQVEFPDNVKNKFFFQIFLNMIIYNSFIFMSSLVYNLAPSAFFLNPYIMFFFGLFSLCLIQFAPLCKSTLTLLYIFGTSYFMAEIISPLYLQISSLSILFSFLIVLIYLKCNRDIPISFSISYGFCLSCSLTLNSLTYFLYDNPFTLLICILDILIIIYLSSFFFYLKQSIQIFTPTQTLEATQYIILFPIHLVKTFIFIIKSKFIRK